MELDGSIESQALYDHARQLGFVLPEDEEFLYLASEALHAPLPTGWQQVTTSDEQAVYFYNATTNTSVWEHPSDDMYRAKLQELRAEREHRRRKEATTSQASNKKRKKRKKKKRKKDQRDEQALANDVMDSTGAVDLDSSEEKFKPGNGTALASFPHVQNFLCDREPLDYFRTVKALGYICPNMNEKSKQEIIKDVFEQFELHTEQDSIDADMLTALLSMDERTLLFIVACDIYLSAISASNAIVKEEPELAHSSWWNGACNLGGALLSDHVLVAATAITIGWQGLRVDDLFEQGNKLLGYQDYFDAVLKCKPAQARFEVFASEGGRNSEKNGQALEDKLAQSIRQATTKSTGPREATVLVETEEAFRQGEDTNKNSVTKEDEGDLLAVKNMDGELGSLHESLKAKFSEELKGARDAWQKESQRESEQNAAGRAELEAHIEDLSQRLEAALQSAKSNSEAVDATESLLEGEQQSLAKFKQKNEALRVEVQHAQNALQVSEEQVSDMEKRLLAALKKPQSSDESARNEQTIALEHKLLRKDRLISELEADVSNLQTLLDKTTAMRAKGIEHLNANTTYQEDLLSQIQNLQGQLILVRKEAKVAASAAEEEITEQRNLVQKKSMSLQDWKQKALASKDREERFIRLEKQNQERLAKERSAWDEERSHLRGAFQALAKERDDQVAELETALAAKSAESIEVQNETLSLLTAAKEKISELQKKIKEDALVFRKKEEDWQAQGVKVAELASNAAAVAEERIKKAAQEAAELTEARAQQAANAAQHQEMVRLGSFQASTAAQVATLKREWSMTIRSKSNELDLAKSSISKLQRQVENNERVKSELTKRLATQEDSCMALVETNARLNEQLEMLQSTLAVLVEETDLQNKRLERAEEASRADIISSIADVKSKDTITVREGEATTESPNLIEEGKDLSVIDTKLTDSRKANSAAYAKDKHSILTVVENELDALKKSSLLQGMDVWSKFSNYRHAIHTMFRNYCSISVYCTAAHNKIISGILNKNNLTNSSKMDSEEDTSTFTGNHGSPRSEKKNKHKLVMVMGLSEFQKFLKEKSIVKTLMTRKQASNIFNRFSHYHDANRGLGLGKDRIQLANSHQNKPFTNTSVEQGYQDTNIIKGDPNLERPPPLRAHLVPGGRILFYSEFLDCLLEIARHSYSDPLIVKNLDSDVMAVGRLLFYIDGEAHSGGNKFPGLPEIIKSAKNQCKRVQNELSKREILDEKNGSPAYSRGISSEDEFDSRFATIDRTNVDKYHSRQSHDGIKFGIELSSPGASYSTKAMHRHLPLQSQKFESKQPYQNRPVNGRFQNHRISSSAHLVRRNRQTLRSRSHKSAPLSSRSERTLHERSSRKSRVSRRGGIQSTRRRRKFSSRKGMLTPSKKIVWNELSGFDKRDILSCRDIAQILASLFGHFGRRLKTLPAGSLDVRSFLRLAQAAGIVDVLAMNSSPNDMALDTSRIQSIIEHVQGQYNSGRDELSFSMSCAVLLRIARCKYLYKAHFFKSSNLNIGDQRLHTVKQDGSAFASLVKEKLIPLLRHLLNQLGRDENEATSAQITTKGAIQLLERAKIACQTQQSIEIPNIEVEAQEHDKQNTSEVKDLVNEESGRDLSWDDLAHELRDANNIAEGLLNATSASSPNLLVY